jgi:hypothetical protein
MGQLLTLRKIASTAGRLQQHMLVNVDKLALVAFSGFFLSLCDVMHRDAKRSADRVLDRMHAQLLQRMSYCTHVASTQQRMSKAKCCSSAYRFPAHCDHAT